jgi:hypothetical protein
MAEREQSFWTSLPGILTGIAALITALVGVVALVLGMRDRPDPATSSGDATEAQVDGTAAPPTADMSQSSDGTGAGASGTGASGGAASGAITLVMARGDGLDIDENLVGNGVRDADVSYYRGNGYLYLKGVSNAVVVGGTDQAGCEEALDQRSDDYVTPDQFGDVTICILTEGGVMARIRPSERDASDRITMELITWA